MVIGGSSSVSAGDESGGFDSVEQLQRLLAALRSDCFYVGALGSQRTQQARRRRLLDEGISEQALERLHGPIGLDIGALTTPEIAVSILAELIQVRRRVAPAG